MNDMTRAVTSGAVELTAYVLTIDEEGGPRHAHATKQFVELGLNGRFVMGATKGDQELSELYSPLKNLMLSGRSLTAGEIAVYAGHRRIWKAIDDAGHSHALVFEDDFHVMDKERFVATLGDCLSAPQHWDIIKFFDFKPKRVVRRLRLGRANLVAYKYPASGAVAYLISRNAARRLLKRPRIFRAVDVDLSWPWEFGLRIWSISPNLVSEISHKLGGSHLEVGRINEKNGTNIFRSVWGVLLQFAKVTIASARLVRFWLLRS